MSGLSMLRLVEFKPTATFDPDSCWTAGPILKCLFKDLDHLDDYAVLRCFSIGWASKSSACVKPLLGPFLA